MEGMTRRQLDQPHTMHAMVIVGYDVPTKRFMVRNSWGEAWGQGGYCFVDYEVMAEISSTQDSEEFLFLAFAMEDILMDAAATPDVGEDVKDSLRIASRGMSDGFNELRRQTSYRYTAEMRGPASGMDLIQSVYWTVPTMKGKGTLNTEKAERNFRVTSTITGEAHLMTAMVTFKDGSTREYAATTALEPPKGDDRVIEIASRDRYYGLDYDSTAREMRHRWYRHIRFLASENVRRDIRAIRFDNGEEIVELIDHNGFDASRKWSFQAWEPEELTATITFADGSQTVRRHVVDAFTDPPNESIYMRAELHPIGDGSQSAYTLSLRMPVHKSHGAYHVDWQLDGSQHHFNTRMSASLARGYPISGSATRDFRARATVHWVDESPPLVIEKWIELPDEGTAYATPLRLDVFPESFYSDRHEDGTPLWNYRLRMSGDWEATRGLEQVYFRYTDHAGEGQSIVADRREDGDWVAEVFELPKDIVFTAHFRHEGKDQTWERTFAATDPVIEGIFLETSTFATWGDGHTRDVHYQARLNGRRWGSSIASVAYVQQANLQVAPGIRREDRSALRRSPRLHQSILRQEDGISMKQSLLTRTTPFAGPITAQVVYQNGDSELLQAGISKIESSWSGAPNGAYRMRVVERYMGPKAEEAFRIFFWLDAAPEEMEKVDHTLVKESTLSWDTAARMSPGQKATGFPGRPSLMDVRIVMKDGNFLEQQVAAPLLAPRVHDLRLKRHRNYIGLEGPGFAIDGLKRVTYHVTPEGGTTLVKDGSDFKFSYGALGLYWPHAETVHVIAELEYKDSRKQQLEATMVRPGTTGVQTETVDQYWGLHDGVPHWLIRHRTYGTADADGQAANQLWTSNHHLYSGRGSDYEVLSVEPEASPLTRRLAYSGKESRHLPDHVWSIQSPILPEKLTLSVSRSWENPSSKEEAKDEWLYRIQGPVRLLDEVLEVDYTVRSTIDGAKFKDIWHQTRRFSTDGDGFRGLEYCQAMHEVEATITFLDGRPPLTLKWSAPASKR